MPPKAQAELFSDLCIHAVQRKCGIGLHNLQGALYATADNKIGSVGLDSSKEGKFWFGFTPKHADHLKGYEDGYVLLGCGSKKGILKIPFREFEPWTKKMNRSTKGSGKIIHWNVRITLEQSRYILHLKGRGDTRDLTDYLL